MAKRTPSDVNLLIAVDKPAGCTSHDVVSRVRRVLGIRRVGHAGTLDPMATGVMVIGVGQATRLLGMLTLDRKSYIASIEFGSETNTDDAEGEVTRTAAWDSRYASSTESQRILDGFTGRSLQVPPAFSAISVNGVRAYKSARAGEAVELPPREIEVYAADLLSIQRQGDRLSWDVAFSVSKGTYIRALARDIGRAIGSAAHISALRRTSSGSVTLARAIPVDGVSRDAVRKCAIDPVAALDIASVLLPEESLPSILNGRSIPVGSFGEAVPDASRCAVLVDSQVRAIARIENDRYVMSDVFPQGIEGVAL